MVAPPRLGSLAAALVALLLVAAPAGAVSPSAPIGTACVNASGANGCAQVANASGLWAPAMSPDGKNVYVAAFNASAVFVFDRDTNTGALTLKQGAAGCVSPSLAGCTVSRLVASPQDVLVSPDGNQVYVTDNSGIAIFNRASDGTLTQKALTKGCINNDGSNGCTDGRAITFANSIVISPDKAFLYTFEDQGQIAEFARDLDNGELTQLTGTAGCVTPTVTADNCATAAGTSGTRQGAISPDGTSVYEPTPAANGITIFDRDTSGGGLSQKPGLAGCITADGSPDSQNGNQLRCTKLPGLSHPSAATVSNDGKQVYLGSNNGMFTFARAADGKLTFQGCISDPAANGCTEGRHMGQMSFSELSPDGLLLVSTSDFGAPTGGVTLFNRDPATGTLTQPAGVDACVTPNGNGEDNGSVLANQCRVRPEVGLDGQPIFANNNQFYVGFFTASAVTVFKRDFYPHCADVSADVPFQSSAAVALTCSDVNGDAPITYAITAQPVSGQLGAVDNANARVIYNPFNAFSGADSFKYTGTAGGLTSPEATASLTVAAKPATPATDLDGDGSFSPQDCNDTNPAIHPGAFDIPGNGVDEDCAGGDTPRPIPKVSSGVSHSWNALKKYTTVIQLDINNLTAGAAITVVCKAKGCPFKTKKLTFPKGKAVAHLAGLFKIKKGKRKVPAKLKTGGKLEVDITAPGSTGKFVSFTMRAKKVPLVASGCLTPGTVNHTAC